MDPPSTLPDWHTLRDETLRAIATRDTYLARHLEGNPHGAAALLRLARSLAEGFGIPQGAYAALRELALQAEPESAAECLKDAEAIRSDFQKWADARQIAAFSTPDGELPAWSRLGVLLFLHGQRITRQDAPAPERVITTLLRAAHMYSFTEPVSSAP
ncbi:hypothetical protein [Sphaerisporangium perillae]|uniref:hypothetical protein n=1 Tax=Sphaerisporangium perillae TaxID=2935860 RepID=UPI00200CB262|nr:hypothetical protein [Sphaerisporangium perillae]